MNKFALKQNGVEAWRGAAGTAMWTCVLRGWAAESFEIKSRRTNRVVVAIPTWVLYRVIRCRCSEVHEHVNIH